MHACTFYDACMQLMFLCIDGYIVACIVMLKKKILYRIVYIKSMYGEKCIQMHKFMHYACVGELFFLWKFKDYFYGHFESCLSTIGAWGQKLWKIFNSFGAANEPAHKEKKTLCSAH